MVVLRYLRNQRVPAKSERTVELQVHSSEFLLKRMTCRFISFSRSLPAPSEKSQMTEQSLSFLTNKLALSPPATSEKMLNQPMQ